MKNKWSKKIPHEKMIWETVFKPKKGVKLPKLKMLTIKFPEMNTERGQYRLNFLLQIAKLWAKYPEQRWGQIMFNYLLDSHFEKDRQVCEDPFHIPDEKYLKHLKKLNNK